MSNIQRAWVEKEWIAADSARYRLQDILVHSNSADAITHHIKNALDNMHNATEELKQALACLPRKRNDLPRM